MVKGGEFLEATIGVGVHGSELQEVEHLVVGAYTLAAVNDVAFAFDANGQSGEQQNGGEYQQGAKGGCDVEAAFPKGEVEGLGEAMLLLLLELLQLVLLALREEIDQFVHALHGDVGGNHVVDACFQVELAFVAL